MEPIVVISLFGAGVAVGLAVGGTADIIAGLVGSALVSALVFWTTSLNALQYPCYRP
jgi:hypothetical protein